MQQRKFKNESQDNFVPQHYQKQMKVLLWSQMKVMKNTRCQTNDNEKMKKKKTKMKMKTMMKWKKNQSHLHPNRIP